jgi:outer membrane receptor protein involved in Fe transport
LVPLGERFDWLIGGFYTHEDTPLYTDQEAMNPLTGAILGPVSTLKIPISNRESAAFTDITVRFTDHFDIQVGGRESFLRTDFGAVLEGGAVLPIPVTLPEIVRNASVFTYLVTPRFKISPELMAYARVSTGYRPSRANTFNTDPTLPRTADPDKTQNYEIGMKGDVLDRTLSFDTSVYYIDWKDIQINLLSPVTGLSYYTNGSRAKSEGVEISVQARPITGLTLSGWGSYNVAELTEGFPAHTAAYGPAGSRLPYSPRWSGNVAAQQDFHVSAGVTGFVGAAVVYNGDRLGTFVATPARAYYPAYTKIDLRAGAEFSGWMVNLYAKNVTDKRGITGGGPGNFPPNAYTVIQPRTIGVSASKNF